MRLPDLRSHFSCRDFGLYWLNGRFAGRRVGRVTEKGYRRVMLAGRTYREHHLVWLWHHGELPASTLDHINGDPSDNRVENLRLATNGQNQDNRTYVMKGVVWRPDRKRWRACLNHNGRRHNLGDFNSPITAKVVYDLAARALKGKYFRP